MANRWYIVLVAKMANKKGREKMTSTNLLKAKMAEKGYNQSQIAELLGITYQSFNRKLNNKVEFKASEINKLCEILDITAINAYFFCNSNSQNG